MLKAKFNGATEAISTIASTESIGQADGVTIFQSGLKILADSYLDCIILDFEMQPLQVFEHGPGYRQTMDPPNG